MPEFIRPRRAIIETGGGGFGGLLYFAALVACIAAVLGAVAFVFSHIWLITGAVVVYGVVMGWLLLHWARRYQRLPAGLVSRIPAPAASWLLSARRADPLRVVQQPVLALSPADVVVPPELDAPAAGAVPGGGDHLAIGPAPVRVEDVNRPRWPDRPAGSLDGAVRAGVLKRRPGDAGKMPR